ncbi:hypothetical protein BT96DRAFT_261406 [Gymnopus androsaceus JB14]|uniref:DUF5648 domain-containing protein n=1 Tax=Gymnopus androsaceus JB14 TaxID=1447944 RepID=A0A6A4H6K9_9AGAR|nr:hypothetical protein BT96DRAFT_261406 [Gymnopus androsaceus JB14]
MFSLLPTLVFLTSWLASVLTCADTSDLVPLWRAYNGGVVDHFYTTNVTEMESALTQDGYSLEGSSAYVWTTQETGTTPLYRLFNQDKNDHFYTMSNDEIAEMLSAGWAYDTTPIAGYVYPFSICGAAPIYRMFNPTAVDHFYTMDIAEGEAASGYVNQGIAGYAVLPSVDGSAVVSSPTPYLLPSTVTASSASEATTSSCATTGDAIPLLRAYSSIGTDHFYTTNSSEMSNAVAVDAYTFEGDATFLWATQETNTVPLYRMFNQNVHRPLLHHRCQRSKRRL